MSEQGITDQLMTREEFHRWTAEHPGRFERIDGRFVAMAPERIAHVRVKAAVWLALRQALETHNRYDCEALADGVTIPVGDHTDYVPDAVVQCGERLSDDATEATNAIIVVEVLSPFTQYTDTGAKLAG